MKHSIAIILFLFCFSYLSAQLPHSEKISLVSNYQIKDNKLIRTDSVVIQVNDRMGDSATEIGIPYSKSDKLTINDAWIEDLNGNIIRKLKSKDIKDQSFISDISLYEDDFIKTFDLKHNVYPYRIVYSFKITFSRFINIATVDLINSRIPIKSGKLVVETPNSQPLKYRQYNVDTPQIEPSENTTTYTWRFKHNPSVRTEVNSSPNSFKSPYIEVVPSDFKYGEQGSFKSWQTFGNWIYRLNLGKDDLPISEKQKIDNLISGITDKREVARILYHYMQDYTRYINVSINIGGLQTYPASYVCINRYGDCKALTNYMQAMLKYAGIKSYYTIINAGEEIIDVDEKFPSNRFNHVILTIPFDKDTIYLECTSKNTAFGYVGTFTQGRKALLVDEHNSHLISIPFLKPEDVLSTRTFNINLGTSETNIKIVERGEHYERASYLNADVDKSLLDKYVRNNILSGSYDIIDFSFKKADRDTTQITMDMKLEMHNLYKEYGNNIIISAFPIRTLSYEPTSQRTSDIQINYPECYKDTIIFSTGKSISKIPTDFEISSPYGYYSHKYLSDNDKLIVYKTVSIYAGRYPLSSYEEFYNFMQTIKNTENKNLYIETK